MKEDSFLSDMIEEVEETNGKDEEDESLDDETVLKVFEFH
jgi:hypothetical protein